MNPTAEDMKDILDNSATGLTFATNLFCFKQPDSPDECVTLYDTGGFTPTPQYYSPIPIDYTAQLTEIIDLLKQLLKKEES